MNTQQPTAPPRDRERHDDEELCAEIRKHVLLTLGQPGHLYDVQVRALWQYRYRVNVRVGADFCSATIAHSYFVVTDDNGTIVAATPTITRRY